MSTEMQVVVVPDSDEFELGEPVTGLVQWSGAPPKTIRIGVSLGIEVSRRGQSRRDSAATVVFDPAPDGEERFSIVAPLTFPPTFDGNAFTIDWLIRARMEVRFGLDAKASTKITVSPAGMRQFRTRRTRDVQFPQINPGATGSG